MSVRFLLVNLVVLDLILAVWGFFFPELWFHFFHGSDYVDPQALLRRCAANWLGFLLVQLWALFRWQRDPRLLPVVAGMRLGDALTDVTCLAFATSRTWAAFTLFPVACIGNLAVGWYLLRKSPR